MTPDALDWDVLQERSLAWAKERWHWVVLIALSVWMYLVRMRPFGNFYRDDGIFFIGTDPYYHARHVVYTVANFPSTLGYDALTQYPLGTDPGQFGTLFDQGAALLAWIAGILVDGGAPSQETTMAVFVAYPAILGALTVFAVYALARRLVSRGPALFAALIIALLPGEFLVRSLAGYVDHHVMEALLSTLAMATLLWALQRWEASGVTLQGIVDAPKGLLDPERRGAWLATALAALAFTAYLWTWPSGVLFIGIVGLWLVVQAGWDVARAREIAPLLITVAGTFLPLALLMVLRVDRAGFTALTYSWMQPVAALGVALAAVAIAALAWVWHVRELPPPWYPGALAGGALLGLGAIQVLLPRLLSQVLSGLSWVTGIGVQRTRLTIAEAQPATFAEMSGEFGLLFWTAMFGFGLVVINALRKHKASDTLLILWAVLMTSATLTQVRFIYYLAVVVAVLNGELAVGHVIVPASAVRDEGTSYHYLAPSREVAATPAAVAAIERTLGKDNVDYVVGKTWTTDAIYRETPGKIALRRQEGCLTVEMEAAAFFAVARFREVTVGQIL
ncbi:MAG: STT3 domain-containing protein, partial [Candidatus Thermoplasmatota archaeon]|nr:STT3 domain-containing protein [Candidatus Thermoplasmatota archaeon]